MSDLPTIDWTPLLKYEPCECRCGQGYYSHTKGVWVGDDFVVVSQKRVE